MDALPPPRASMLFAVLPWVFVVAVFGLAFWGYPLQRTNFSDFHFYTKDLPPLWGLSVVDPQTHRINYAFLFHNEGLMALMYFLLNHLALATAQKLVFVNLLNIGIQFLNISLFALVLRKLVGPSHVFPYLMVFVLYPFAAANRYWQACMANNLTATLFLTSFYLFLQVDDVRERLFTNLVFRVVPSIVLLWFSIIMVEFAIALSPIYVYLALYRGNGKRTALRFKKFVTPYTVSASLFLLTSLVPIVLFTGHRLTVLSYMSRYSELATQMNLAASLAAVATIVVNALLACASFFFANTIGVVVYPLAEVLTHHHLLSGWSPLRYLGVLVTTGLGMLSLWGATRARTGKLAAHESDPDFRFLAVLGLLWMVLAYGPFSISFGYPRNVGLIADRINLLGAMGATILLGSGLCIVCDRKRSRGLFCGVGVMVVVLLLHTQLQKDQYLEAQDKESAVVSAVLDSAQRLRAEGRTPIFLLHRQAQIASPRAKVREALNTSPAPLRFMGLARFLWERYLTQPTVSTSFHLNGIHLFSCCPATAQPTFDFYADWRDVPRPVVFKQEEPFRLSEEAMAYRLGYPPTEVWQEPSTGGDTLSTYPKKDYQLVVMDIGESTFLPGGPLQYRVQSYRGEEK